MSNTMKYLSIFSLGIFIIFMFNSCSKKKEEELKEEQDKIISEYITSNNIDATKSNSGLYYSITKEGSSKKPNSTSQVRVSYKGYLINGTELDKGDSTGVVFKLNQVIEGWTEGIPYFGEGGEGTLLIPSHLGYGSQTKSNIPKNSILIFDIVLHDVYWMFITLSKNSYKELEVEKAFWNVKHYICFLYFTIII